ncbi:hypothetical protein CDAR_585881 [Caerostris darwini]|uniref:Uncharacterized protein n=1 Tax=Caerostris darwini TaxID=1538125 RepID=A0AAV4TMT5_9ARAC|nr:hypothetical protein CDAR_585881 [Caerostris darwini]
MQFLWADGTNRTKLTPILLADVLYCGLSVFIMIWLTSFTKASEMISNVDQIADHLSNISFPDGNACVSPVHESMTMRILLIFSFAGVLHAL